MNAALADIGTRIARLDTFVLRAPCAPVRTSFGVMNERPAILIRVEDLDGAQGWGEVWCNFPACGASHRAALLRTLVAPALLIEPAQVPADYSRALTQRFAVLALQSGEHGPFAQVIAGVDQALWDLAARRAGEPLWRFLGGSRQKVPVYASGIGPDGAIDTALEQQAAGHRAFKLKVGFNPQADLQRVARLRKELGSQAHLMIDANQAWAPEDAANRCQEYVAHALDWIEEPMRVDQPWSAWQALARAVPMPLAGGENLTGNVSFDEAIQSGSLGVLQPDLAKWGGITGCMAVARRALAAGLRYCPHYLGAGVGLAMSAHVLAAVGGDGLLEMDINPNPLRDLFGGGMTAVREGIVVLSNAPGFGTPPELALMNEFAVSK